MALADAAVYADAAWSLDEASGDRIDSVSSLTLADHNTVASTAGLFSNAASFVAASSEYLNISYTPPTGTMTICVWIKTTSNNRPILNFNDVSWGTSGTHDRILKINSDGTVSFYVYDGAPKTVTSTTSVDDGNWHLIVAVIDGSLRVSIDGVEEGTLGSVSNGYNGYGSPYLTVGVGYHTTNNYFNGDIDELVILDGYALNSSEVTELWNSGTGVAFADWDAGGGGGLSIPIAMRHYLRMMGVG